MSEKNWQLMDELNALKQKINRWGDYGIFNEYREAKRESEERPSYWRMDAPEMPRDLSELKRCGCTLESIVGYGQMSMDEIENEIAANSPPCFV